MALKKEQYGEITKVSNEVVTLDLNDFNSFLYYNGVNYNKFDLMVIYKIRRMFDLGYIDEKRHQELIDLYSEYLDLSTRSERIFFLKNYGEIEDYPGYKVGMEDEIDNRISEIEKTLGEYGLYPDEMFTTSLIDDSIKLRFVNKK